MVVTVEVQTNTQQIDYAEVHLTFDPAVLQVQSITTPGTSQLPAILVPLAFDNTSGTIAFGAGEFVNFPSGTFDLIEITFTAVGGPSTDVEFDFVFPSETKATFSGANVLTGTTSAQVNVNENPELVITPDLFAESLGLNGTATNIFAVSTSDGNAFPGDLNVVSSEPWLTINPGFNGYSINAAGLGAGAYSATITASGTGYDDGFATVNLTVQAPPAPAAFIAVNPGAGLGASTFTGGSFQITNTGNIDITGVSFDLSTGILPDMVWDPVGTGGDATASCLTVGVGAAATGFVAPGDPCTDPFSVPRQGGFDVASLTFTDFNNGETFTFKSDNDPNSIQGVPGAGAAGAVSGYELIGSTVTVTFADGTVLTGNLFEEGTLGGANLTLEPAAPAAPSIELQGFPAQSEIIVADVNQIVTISGNPGDLVTLLQMDSRLFIASGDPPFNVSPFDSIFYANEAMAGKAVFSQVIGTGGTVDVPVTLFQTAGAPGTPSGGKNQFIAVTTPAAYTTTSATSPTSNVLTVRYFPGYNPAAVVNVTPGESLDASTFDDDSFELINTGTVDILSVSIDLSTGYLMDVVFDPIGTAGDSGSKCLEDTDSVGTPGYVIPGDNCVDPFSQFHNGVDVQEGYDVLTLNFANFGGGEEFHFALDLDPTSIKNDITTGDAGSISGAEIVGATVTITFADGTILTRCLWTDGSDGGATVELTLDDLTSPAISMQGFPTSPIQTGTLNQTIDISGPPNADIQLLQWDTRLYIDAGSPNPYDIDPFEANENMTKVIYAGTLDGNGLLSIPVTLLQTISSNAGPDGGINHFMAVVTDTGLTSCMSNVIIAEVVPTCTVADLTPVLCEDAASLLDLTQYEPSITVETGTFAYATGGNTIADPTMVPVTDGQLINVTFNGVNGCVEPSTILFTVNPVDTTNVFSTTCDPSQVGVTQFTLSNQYGCDSVVITTTTLLPSDTTNVFANTCDPGQVGVTQFTLTNQFGCDSVVITTTTLLPSDTTSVFATTCDPVQVGVTQFTLTNQFGCDSVVITTTTLLPSDTTTIMATSCDPAQVGTVQQVFSNQFGCDSTVITTTSLVTLLPNLANVACDDNGTPGIPGDDFIVFELTPSGTNLGLAYTLSGDLTAGPTAYANGTTSYSTAPGSAGAGNLAITVTDTATGCSETIVISDPGTCSNANLLTFEFGNQFGTTGYGVCVPVTVQNYDSIFAGQGGLTWDPTVISYDSVTNFGTPGLEALDFTTIGSDKLIFLNIEDPFTYPFGFSLADDDTLFEICFTVVGQTGDVSPISFTNVPTPVEWSQSQSTGIPAVVSFVEFVGSVTIIDPIPVRGATLSWLGDTLTDVSYSIPFPIPDAVVADSFEFGIPANQDGTIFAEKLDDFDPDAGVTAIDVLLTQLHILNTFTFSTPYQLLAADVNQSGTITNIDIFFMENIILQNLSTYFIDGGTLADTTLWRILPQGYVFPDPANPWNAPNFREIVNAQPVSYEDENFLGLKLGDVNFNWMPPFGGLREEVHGEVHMLAQVPENATPGATIKIPISTKFFRDIASYSYTLNWDPSVLKFVTLNSKAHDPRIGIHSVERGALPLLWVQEYAQGEHLPDGTVLYELEFEVIGDIGSQALIEFGESITPMEAYTGSLLRYAVVSSGGNTQVGLQSTSISQDDIEGYRLIQNRPNPFSQSTEILFSIPTREEVTISIYNGLGQIVWKGTDIYQPGPHSVTWNRENQHGHQVANGVYTLVLTAGPYEGTLRMSIQP